MAPLWAYACDQSALSGLPTTKSDTGSAEWHPIVKITRPLVERPARSADVRRIDSRWAAFSSAGSARKWS